ncbi:SMP-30/gluconolactonase/LRE family protein [Streptomyces tubercidicus]|uniref:SMP-30/gluconolactonase/LRE family protein n=1 Tax=Streptomyces tubercidicus TaxID=47759 RepID=UPI00369B986B
MPHSTPPAEHTPAPVRILADGDCELGEGARWVDGRLVITDILAGRLLEITGQAPGRIRTLAALEVPLGAVAPVHGAPGSWIAAAGTGIALLGADGQLAWLAHPEDRTRVPTRMNDGACDPLGRFWATSMPYDNATRAGCLYRTDSDGSVHQVLRGMTVVNGPAFTDDGSILYVADSSAGIIYRCPLDADGTPTDQQEFTRLANGSPDGMTVDTQGHLWVAVWGAGQVHRYHPSGALLTALDLPTPQPTSVCLHPTAGQLMITTARYGLIGHGHGPAGAVLATEVDATATAARPYVPSRGPFGPPERRPWPRFTE